MNTFIQVTWYHEAAIYNPTYPIAYLCLYVVEASDTTKL